MHKGNNHMSSQPDAQKKRVDERLLSLQGHVNSILCLHKNRIDNRNDPKSQDPFFRGSTCHMLCAISLEIAIKILWDLEHGDNDNGPRHIHNLLDIFPDLDKKVQQDLKDMYYKKAKELANIVPKDINVKISSIAKIAMSLCEVLRANRDIMVNFKYDNQFSGKSSAMGIVLWDVNKDRTYCLPPQTLEEIFSQTLLSYVEGKVREKYPS